MGIGEKEGGLPVFDTDRFFVYLFYFYVLFIYLFIYFIYLFIYFFFFFFGQLLRLLPGSWVKSAQIYPSRRG